MVHKRTCQSHILNKNTMDPGTMQNLHQEKLLSNWLNVWHGLFEEFAMRALDLVNHKGEERTKTHWRVGVWPCCGVLFLKSNTFDSFMMIIQETGSPDVAKAFHVGCLCTNHYDQEP